MARRTSWWRQNLLKIRFFKRIHIVELMQSLSLKIVGSWKGRANSVGIRNDFAKMAKTSLNIQFDSINCLMHSHASQPLDKVRFKLTTNEHLSVERIHFIVVQPCYLHSKVCLHYAYEHKFRKVFN